jgi:hypothetical protein
MNTITTEAIIISAHKLKLNLDLPIGNVKVTLTLESQANAPAPVNRLAEIRGLGKGKVWMSDDFDEPLDDFAEYM